MIKAVVFDLDDTLISEKEYIESGYAHISKILSPKLKIEEDEIKSLLLKLLSISSKNVFNRLFDQLGVFYSREEIIELVEEYRNHLPNISFFEDVIPCLKLLRKEKIKTGIITDGFKNAQRQKLRAIKASKYFDEIIVTDELGREFWKPHPRAFEIIKEKFAVEFTEMIYIGDNPSKDFYIGKDYPIKTIRIKREYGIHQNNPYLEKVYEHHLIKSLTELKNFLD